MCDTRDFHAALSRLAYGHAENTIAYIQDEARRIDEKCKAEQWRDCGEQMTVADKTLLEDMMCDPAAGRCVIRSDGTVLNINERMAGWIGQCRNAMVGTCLWSYFPPHVVSYRKQIIYHVLRIRIPQYTMDRAGSGHPMESVVVPMSNGCIMVLSRRIPHQRVFKEAFSVQPRVIE